MTAKPVIASRNPCTGEILRTFEPLSEADVDDRLQRAQEASRAYRQTTFAGRARWLRHAATILEAESDGFARLLTLEMGKTLRSAVEEIAEVRLGLPLLRGQAAGLLADEVIETNATLSARPLPATGAGAGGHALELPLLAGLPLRRPGADGGQRRPAQTRLERARSAPWPSRRSSAGRVSPKASSRRCSSARVRCSR